MNSMLKAGRPSAKEQGGTLASLSDKGPMKRVNFQVTSDEHTKLKIYAAKQGRTITEVLTEFVTGLPDE